MENLIWIITAHAIGDWGMQGQFFKDKSISPWILSAHSILWAGCISIALKYIGIFAVWKFIFLVVGHYLCDGIKNRKVYLDQAWHGLQCLIVTIF